MRGKRHKQRWDIDEDSLSLTKAFDLIQDSTQEAECPRQGHNTPWCTCERACIILAATAVLHAVCMPLLRASNASSQETCTHHPRLEPSRPSLQTHKFTKHRGWFWRPCSSSHQQCAKGEIGLHQPCYPKALGSAIA
eukprot:989856-Pelagomonas_calceolata.AAC.5